MNKQLSKQNKYTFSLNSTAAKGKSSMSWHQSSASHQNFVSSSGCILTCQWNSKTCFAFSLFFPFSMTNLYVDDMTLKTLLAAIEGNTVFSSLMWLLLKRPPQSQNKEKKLSVLWQFLSGLASFTLEPSPYPEPPGFCVDIISANCHTKCTNHAVQLFSLFHAGWGWLTGYKPWFA